MISAVILTHNEEQNIADCLESVSWCEERIVIDDYSQDKTVAIAKKHGATVYQRHLANDFSSQRNFGLEKAHGEWVLFVDADERVSSALWYEIMAQTNTSLNNYAGFFLKRTDVMWGKALRYGEVGSVRLLRLAKKSAGQWEGTVHEVWRIKGKTAVLKNPLMHYPHPTVAKFLEEINYYSTLRAKELFEKKVFVSWWHIIAYPKMKFIVTYFFKLGLLDGLAGLVFALMMSFHSFLVRGKLWLLWQKESKKY